MFNKKILFGLLLALAACNNETNEPAKEIAENSTAAEAAAECYQYITAKDTVLLQTTSNGSAVTGKLYYHYDGKDRNEGTIQGTLAGDMLVADYTFMSEGSKSVRQVAFKKEGDNYKEGYGNIEDTNGRVSFKSLDSLTFSNSFPLSKVDCKN